MQTFIHDFFNIWEAWWNASEPISQNLLWGHPVFFWGRCGKVMELIAAFFLLYEILGREKSSEAARKFVRTYAAEWQAAMVALILVAETGGPTMFARIAMTQALYLKRSKF